MRFRKRARAPIAAVAAAVLLPGLIQGGSVWAGTAAQAADATQSSQEAQTSQTSQARQAALARTKALAGHDTVAAARRDALLGKGWKRSGDRAWTTTGDADGFHLMVADKKNGYTWRTAATLSEPGFDADAWIGNACVTASGQRAVVVYAPRTFTNKTELMARGGFTAVVDLGSGKVTKLNLTASLSYYSPGCGTGETAVFTQSPGEDKTSTRLIKVNASTGKLAEPVEARGQLTSAVVAKNGTLVAAAGANVVRIDGRGRKSVVAQTDGVPYRLMPDSAGGLVFLDKRASVTKVKRIAGITKKSRPAVLAQGPLTATGLTRSAGTVYVTGDTEAVAAKLPATVRRLARTAKDATLSTRGEAVLAGTAWADGKGSTLQPQDAVSARPVTFGLTTLSTGKRAAFTVDPAARQGAHAAQGRATSPRLSLGHGAAKSTTKSTAKSTVTALGVTAASSSSDPVEDERTCSVPRNDPKNQAMQPKPRQVEWAVDQAITGNLNSLISRPANWKNLGMPAYMPQSLFLNPPLDGGSRVPAQVMLGVATQESNMWQASRVAIPGVTSSPLIGNYYGIDLYDGDTSNDWDVDFAEADCGYGITQVTDHMRLAGREDGHGGAAWDYQKQRAAALDYTANIAAGLQILVDKWNTTRAAGLIANNGDPLKPENWIYALWAYNSGFHPDLGDGSPWGVGWANNPANPEWDAGRLPFMENSVGGEDASAAARPQNWPYQEKVLGFAAHPPAFIESPGVTVPAFRNASWNGTSAGVTVAGSALYNRAHVKPDENLFCDSSNSCDPSKISDSASNDTSTSGPCSAVEFECWWHKPITWKTACSLTCGNELVRFDNTYAEQADGTAYAPNCTTSGLPSGALIVDDVPASAPVVRPGCTNSWTNSGSFAFDFGNNGVETVYPSKVDTHQLGAGFGGHFYFGHARADDAKGQRLKVTGTWSLNSQLDSAAKVYVHIPDIGAQAQEVHYQVKSVGGWDDVQVNQLLTGGENTNRWVALGAWQFHGMVPQVRLSTVTVPDEDGNDIAFDAVAFVPGDYSDMPEISFPDADTSAPEINYADQSFDPVPTPPTNFENLTGATGSARREVAAAQGARSATALAAQRKLAGRLTEAGATAVFESCPITGSKYSRYTACLKSSTPLTFAVEHDGTVYKALFNVDQQMQLYKNESSIDQTITITPVSIDPGLGEISLEWRSTCQSILNPADNICGGTATTYVGSPNWPADIVDHHSVTAGIGNWWTGTSGVSYLKLTSLLTAITPLGGATTTWSDDDLQVRCDVIMGNEEVPETKPGCVFPRYTPTLSLNTDKRPAASALYWLLQEKLETHPGSKKFKSPLTRQRDQVVADKNRDIICDSTFILHPTGTSENGSCDEYPFAKSRQSGAGSLTSGKSCAQFYAEKSGSRWQLKYDTAFPLPSWKEICGRGSIPLSQNTGAGGELGRFTTAMRLHDEDAYYVDVPGFDGCTPTACDLP